MWKDIEFNDKYEVSDKGIVRRKDNKNILSGFSKKGYRIVSLINEKGRKQKVFIHQLVAQHFLPTSSNKKMVVAHKNGNKQDNRVENLEPMTAREYNFIQYQNQKRKKNGNVPIPVVQFDLLGNEIARYPTIRAASQATNLKVFEIARCVHGEIPSASGYIFKKQ